MPDLFSIVLTKWKLIIGLTVATTLLVLVLSLLQPKQYGATTTALPANSTLSDKARIFNNNIESLYPELGSVDELDRIEGIAKLDTIYITTINAFHLITHYGITNDGADSLSEAVIKLKKATEIRRSEYGSLRVTVWAKDPALAAQLANKLMDELNDLYLEAQIRNNVITLEKLKLTVAQKYSRLQLDKQGRSKHEGVDGMLSDTALSRKNVTLPQLPSTLPEQIMQLEQLIDQYKLAIEAAPQPLIVVEQARATKSVVKPDLLQITLFAFAASFLFSILLAFFLQTRNQKA